jgi:hypothetical protein
MLDPAPPKGIEEAPSPFVAPEMLPCHQIGR